mmetsp:Transcript_27063/g.77493  ORF Transcript_27063/g.77493 Transcript_27063/m.77493 type:complete len:231 (+) Transcript_27063:243-935(+)
MSAAKKAVMASTSRVSSSSTAAASPEDFCSASKSLQSRHASTMLLRRGPRLHTPLAKASSAQTQSPSERKEASSKPSGNSATFQFCFSNFLRGRSASRSAAIKRSNNPCLARALACLRFSECRCLFVACFHAIICSLCSSHLLFLASRSSNRSALLCCAAARAAACSKTYLSLASARACFSASLRFNVASACKRNCTRRCDRDAANFSHKTMASWKSFVCQTRLPCNHGH